MRWQLASTFAAAVMSGCYGPNSIICDDGTLCPATKACAGAGQCGEPAPVEACFGMGKQQFESCTVGSAAGSCIDGACRLCDADLLGCAQESWQAMTSTVDTDLLSVYVFPPAPGLPVIAAYAGGVGGVLLAYDGYRWSRVVDGPPTTSTINGIWGSSPDNVYVVTNTKGELFHFDGLAWRDIGAELPTAAETLRAIAGRSSTEIYAVGGQGTIVTFNGTDWQLRAAPPGPNLFSVATTSTGFVAAGGLGYFGFGDVSSASLSQPPLPSPHEMIAVNDVFVSEGKLVAVGAHGGAIPLVFERVDNIWSAVPTTGLTTVELKAGFGRFVGGELGTIVRDTGAGWASMPAPGDNGIRRMSGAGGEVFAVGTGGVIWRVADP